MTFLKNAWYVAAWPNEVTSGEMLSRTICAEAMVLYRDAQGAPAALEDRCCHRAMPLSQGWLEADCTVRCGYHGLRFDAQGTCVEIPGQDRIPEKARVRAFPCAEKHGWVWVWPGDPDAADPELVPALFAPNVDPDWTVIGNTSYVRANYQLLSDNLLDLTHETFLHHDSLGDDAIPEFPISVAEDGGDIIVTRWILDHVPAPFWKAALNQGDVRCDRWQIVRFTPPSGLFLEVGVASVEDNPRENGPGSGAEGFNSHAVTPETEDSCWYFWTFGRKFQRDDLDLTERLKVATKAIIDEDIRAIEAVHATMARDPDRGFVDIRVDSGAIRARRMVARLIETERAGSAVASVR